MSLGWLRETPRSKAKHYRQTPYWHCNRSSSLSPVSLAEDHVEVDDDIDEDDEDDYDDEQYDLYLLQRTMQRWMYCRSRTPMAMLAARITAIKIRSR